MNIKRTVYSIAAGALMLCHPPALAFSLKQALGYTLLMGGFTAGGVAYQWARESYNKGKQQFNDLKNDINGLGSYREQLVKIVSMGNQAVNEQGFGLDDIGKNIINAIDGAKDLPEDLQNAANAFSRVQERGDDIQQKHKKVSEILKKANDDQQKNVTKFGLVNGILAGMHQNAQKHHFWKMGHYNNISNDIKQNQNDINAMSRIIMEQNKGLKQAIDNAKKKHPKKEISQLALECKRQSVQQLEGPQKMWADQKMLIKSK